MQSDAVECMYVCLRGGGWETATGYCGFSHLLGECVGLEQRLVHAPPRACETCRIFINFCCKIELNVHFCAFYFVSLCLSV